MKNTLPGILEKAFQGGIEPDDNSRETRPAGLTDDFFFQLVRNTRDMVFHARVLPEFKYDYVSPSCLAITGYTPQDFYNDPELAKKCWHPDDMAAMEKDRILASSLKGEPQEVRWIRKDSTVVWLEHLITFVQDKDGNPTECQIIARDITARKRGEEALQEHQIFTNTLLAQAPHATVVIRFS